VVLIRVHPWQAFAELDESSSHRWSATACHR
jgi:hypothetical protein